MKFIVSLNYKHFVFETIEEAGRFACTAKDRSLDPDLEVKIEVHENPEAEDQED